MKPGITGLVVFGTGEEILRRCLASMKPAVDEIVAVDTGAKDGARAVAESFGARIYDLEWPDSFQDAYNFAIDQVDTEWALWLDSDEWLEEDAPRKIREMIGNKRAMGYSLVRQDFYDDTQFTEMYQVRMWRAHPKMRLQGHIHARFPRLAIQIASVGRHIFVSDLRLLHDGFKGGVTDDKHRRNLAYLEREMAERPGQLYYEICHAETLHSLKDPAGAEAMNRLVDRCLDSTADATGDPLLAVAFSIALESTPDEQLDSERIDKIIRLAWRWFPRGAPMIWAIASAELRRGNVFSGYHALLEMEEVARTGSDRSYSYNPEVLGIPLYLSLAKSAGALGKLAVASRAAEAVLAIDPENAEALSIREQVSARSPS